MEVDDAGLPEARVQTSVTFTAGDLAWCREQAVALDVPVSHVLRQAVKHYRAHQEGADHERADHPD